MADILSSILGNVLGGVIGGQGNGQQSQYKAVQGDTLTHGDWWQTALESSSDAILCTAAVWVVIGRYQVPSQQVVSFGFGSPAYPDNQGYAYIALYDDTATNSVQEHGSIRLIQRDYNDYIPKVVKADRTRIWAADKTDRKKAKPLPEQTQVPLVGEDSYLEIQFMADATDTLVETAIGTAAGEDIWDVPITRRIL